MAIGPDIREGVIYDRAVESIDLVPTLGAMLGFSPSFAHGKPISELV
jgi:arylsulfatase A-like enzyme